MDRDCTDINEKSQKQNNVCAKERRKGDGMTILLLILGFPIWFPLLVAAFCILLSLAIVIATLAMVVPWSLMVSFGASALGLLIATPFVFFADGIVEGLLFLGAVFVLAALCIFTLWVALRLTVLGAKGIGAMFKGFFKLLFGRRNRA